MRFILNISCIKRIAKMIVRHDHHDHDHHDHDHQFYNRRVQGSISPSSSCSSTSSGSLGSSSFPFQPNSNSQGSSTFQFQPNPSSEHQPQFQTGKRFGSLQPLLQPKAQQALNAGQWKSTSRWDLTALQLSLAPAAKS